MGKFISNRKERKYTDPEIGICLTFLRNSKGISVAKMVEDEGPDIYSKCGRVLSSQSTRAAIGFKGSHRLMKGD